MVNKKSDPSIKTQIAIVIDEYGGTAGIVTIEVLVEVTDKRIEKVIIRVEGQVED